MFGVSVYLLKEYTCAQNQAYIRKAAEHGYKYLFTSLHIPEVDYRQKLAEMKDILKTARECDFHVIADVSPLTFELFGATPGDITPFVAYGVKTLRLDYGFDIGQTVQVSRNEHDVCIELNASTVSERRITALLEAGVPAARLRACHNFYPKPYTGLTVADYSRKTAMVRNVGLQCSTFVPSQSGKRGPLFEGVPTIEAHRRLPAQTAAKYFLYEGAADRILFGDAYASDAELVQVASLARGVTEIAVDAVPELGDTEARILLHDVYTSRADSPAYLIRASESRQLGKDAATVRPGNCGMPRKSGAVTIDNSGFGRYSGELNICLEDLPADERVNVVAYVRPEEMELLRFVEPGSKFCLRLR